MTIKSERAAFKAALKDYDAGVKKPRCTAHGPWGHRCLLRKHWGRFHFDQPKPRVKGRYI